MKLYATTTSERASKGQGGNQYLIIDLTVQDADKNISSGQIEIYYSNDHKKHGTDLNEWIIQYRPHEDDDWNIIAQGNVKPAKIKAEIECGCEKDKFACSKHYKSQKAKDGEKCITCGAKYREKSIWCSKCKHLKSQ